MINRLHRRNLLAVLVALALPLAAAALDATQWRHQQTVTIGQAGVTKFRLPAETLGASRSDYADLRLLDASGRELPYVLHVPAAQVQPTSIAPRRFTVSLHSDSTEVLIETGTPVALRGVALQSPVSGFLKSVRVEVADAHGEWTLLHEGAPLFRQAGAEQLTLDLGGTATTRVRLTIDDTRTRPVALTGATLLADPRVQPPETFPVEANVTSRAEFAGETVIALDLGARHLPLAYLEIETPERVFTRRVALATRALRHEELAERELASGTVYRLAVEGRTPEAELQVPAAFTAPARELVVRISNADSPALELTAVRVFQCPVWLVFSAPAAGEYRLLTGNPRAAPPRYDAGRLVSALPSLAPDAPRIDPLAANPGFAAPDELENAPLLGAEIDVSRWSQARTVRLERDGVHMLELDPAALAGMSNQGADLRLVREGRQIPYILERPQLFRELTLSVQSQTEGAAPGHSRWRLPLAFPGLPIHRLTVQTGSALFQRTLTISEPSHSAQRREDYRQIAVAEWNRRPGESDQLAVPLTIHPASDHLLIDTDNGDNPPLVLTKARVTHPVVRLIFRAQPGVVTLHYGNPRAIPARYDVALLADPLLNAERHPAKLEAVQEQTRSAWSELVAGKLSLLFWGVLTVVTVTLLVIVAKLLPRQK